MQTPLLKKLLKSLEGIARLALVGIGSEIRGDDRAGLLVSESLKRRLASKHLPFPVRVITAHTAPENFTGELRDFAPSHVILFDCAEMGEKPGVVSILDPREFIGESAFTHRLPMKMFLDYLTNSIGCRVIVVGIEPVSTELFAPVSDAVKKSVRKTVDLITRRIINDGTAE